MKFQANMYPFTVKGKMARDPAPKPPRWLYQEIQDASRTEIHIQPSSQNLCSL